MDEWVKSEVYDVLARIYHWSGCTKEEMDAAIEWFQTHFWEENEDE